MKGKSIIPAKTLTLIQSIVCLIIMLAVVCRSFGTIFTVELNKDEGTTEMFNSIVNGISDEENVELPDKVEVNAQANVLEVTGPNTNLTLEELPTEIVVENPGTYTLTQMDMSGETVIENIYVKIPATESDICLEEESLQNPYFFEVPEDNYLDLLFYFALAVVMLLFIEWWLKYREQI